MDGEVRLKDPTLPFTPYKRAYPPPFFVPLPSQGIAKPYVRRLLCLIEKVRSLSSFKRSTHYTIFLDRERNFEEGDRDSRSPSDGPGIKCSER